MRSNQEVLLAIMTVLHQRLHYISSLAANTWWTEEEWHQWYADKPLSDTHMKRALKEWKHQFPMKQHARDAISKYEAENKKKQKRRQKASEQCICSILATNLDPQAVGISMLQIPIHKGRHLASIMGILHAIKRACKGESTRPAN